MTQTKPKDVIRCTTALLLFCFAILILFTPSYAALKEGETAPDFTLKSIDGKDYKLSDYKDKAIILAFWKSD